MNKVTPKAETFQILRDSGKSMYDAYKLAGFKGNSVSAPYKLAEKIKKHALTDPKLLKTSKKVAKHILDYKPYASSRLCKLLRGSKTV